MDIQFYDLETPEKCFLASFYTPEDDTFHDFLIHKGGNDLYKLVKYLEETRSKYFGGYNSIKFDNQILQFIWENYQKWYDLSNEEISKLISDFGSEEIEKSNYGLFNTYKEENFTFKTLDMPAVWHFFNENKRVSLKQLEFEMRAETIENLEFDMKQEFNEKDLEDLIKYCHNDIRYTYQHYLFTIGETEHRLYKGKNKLIDRQIIMDEVGLPCLNYDDVKIGAEWNKKDYLELSGRSEKDLKPKKVNHFYGRKYINFFPKTVNFQSKEVKSFVDTIGDTIILAKKQEFVHRFNENLEVCIGRGGIHSREKFRQIRPEKDEIYLQCDIGSQYPNAMRKYKVYPKHLGIEWNQMLVGKIERRLKYKTLYKETKEPKYNSLQEMGKLSLNGGAYGRLNTQGDWQEDPCCMLQVTLGCQLEILMIVEALLLKDFEVVSVNTDGYDVVLDRDRLGEFFDICSYYEELIGNKELGNIEYTEFQWIVQSSVNDYIAKKAGEWNNRVFIPHKSKEKDDDLKQKGDFEYWKELNKNSSFSILPLTYQKYFNEGVNPDEFINNHQDIFDFCARSSSGQTYIHKYYKDNKDYTLPKLIRYYVSKDGVHIKKLVKEEVETNANDANVQPAEFKKVVCNSLYKDSHEGHLKNINRQWYIDKVNEMIYQIERGKKAKRQKINKNQINLF